MGHRTGRRRCGPDLCLRRKLWRLFRADAGLAGTGHVQVRGRLCRSLRSGVVLRRRQGKRQRAHQKHLHRLYRPGRARTGQIFTGKTGGGHQDTHLAGARWQGQGGSAETCRSHARCPDQGWPATRMAAGAKRRPWFLRHKKCHRLPGKAASLPRQAPPSTSGTRLLRARAGPRPAASAVPGCQSPSCRRCRAPPVHRAAFDE